ncbi:peptide/nickel transport system substrate-binding protein [Tistlia consotensis]|uniref:Peptide/nickel transport system substrate-binding protein n=1 Tax=Tistlia consotensis USBA 355 TaxID=560819 RepID=A0A1Y6C4Q8_9PROT|nr:ABC transporter substrate-binding protein [Tistlia consotensis]SMF36780.1 peptide/nickel transport system substrate-binding protein [Tistlia consotensis USBA 355]SNR72098.1 peptide/nickel transport system substrate-binding protein [Tistlia consotensis]
MACLLVAVTLSTAQAADRALRMAYDIGDIATLDPHRGSSHVDRAIADMLFNGLVRVPPGQANISTVEPDLAESWEVGDGGKRWVFHLRHGVMFHPWKDHPAYEMTADDVVFSLEKAMDPKTSAYASEYDGFTVKALDRYTVEIDTAQPVSETLFLAKVMNYAGGFIVSKKAYEDLGPDGFRLHPVGTGPFMFKDYVPKERISFVANERYFRGKPKLPGVELLFMPDVSARGIGLRTGELDLIQGSSEESWVKLMRSYPGISVKVFGPGSASILFLNTKSKPLDDIRVRQAIAYALSRQAVVAAIGAETATPLYAPFPGEYLPGGLTTEEVRAKGLDYPTDIAKAKALLAEAGYPDGISLDVVHTELAVMLRPMENIQAQLRKAGINLNLKVVDHPTFHSLIRKDASQIVHYMAWRPNADVFLTRFYDSSSDITAGSKPDTNFSHYSGVDGLIAEAKATTDARKQAELWKRASVQILEDLPAIPVFQGRVAMGVRDTVDLGYDLDANLAFFIPITETVYLSD